MPKATITIEIDFNDSGITCLDDPEMVKIVQEQGGSKSYVEWYIKNHFEEILIPTPEYEENKIRSSIENFRAFSTNIDVKVNVDEQGLDQA